MGTWDNTDGLHLEFGVTKTVAEPAGDFRMPGDVRILELQLDLTTLTASAAIQSYKNVFGTQMFIEEIIVDTETGATGGTSFSLGLVRLDKVTPIATTTFLSAVPIADHATAGLRKSYTVGVTGVGTAVGTTIGANAGYITALAAGTYTAGKVKIRIRYRGFGTITQ